MLNLWLNFITVCAHIVQDHCHYQGYVENDNQSMVSISTCSGLSGLILTQGRRYLIEPQNLAEGMHVIYEEEEENPKACAVTDGHWEGSVLAQWVLPIPTQDQIDHLVNVQKFVELVVVADISMVSIVFSFKQSHIILH
ncbi:zinc metalloproteinase/disintegrin ussurin-like [Rana temporaria]|uniref:zinc metalloproteinase/disintegrin ussurin-like n=1 Tax=Rana temporaria TaxID=8407 RepID=UPI001AAD8A5E|nr:zinc metalloproteinase/disintegrin ussurin-like [Rana temporaria]